ncbi:glycerophosphotransferase [Flammeovirgaceae bacterium 311]|nr:glycerophosphotransferase [Flammeovirgaceae bacterium 311]
MSIMRVYLIERPLSQTETEGFLDVLRQHDADVFLAVPGGPLEQAGAKLWAGLSAAEVNSVNEQLLQLVNRLGHAPAGKDTVAGHLLYRGFPGWYYHKFRINFGLQQRYQQVAGYQKLLQGYDQLVIYTFRKPDPLLLTEPHKMVFVTDRAGDVRKKKQNFSNFLPQLGRKGERFLTAAGQAWELKGHYPKHLFVLNHSHLRPILDPDHLPETYFDNVFVGYFLRDWAEHFLLFDKQILEKGRETGLAGAAGAGSEPAAAPNDYASRKMLNNEWVEEKALLNPAVLWQVRRYSKHLKRAYNRILKHLKDPQQRVIMQEFIKLHHSSLYFFFVYQAYRRFFRSNKFESVTLLDEYSPNFRAIIDAAKQEGVRTQAIQHGSLAASNPGYGYSVEDMRFNPWPDWTLVWGTYWKDLLQKIAAYPPERLLVCGQIRTDVIPKLQQVTLDSGRLLGPQTEDKFLILFATQPQPDEGLRQRAALDTFAVARQMPDAWVVVKPHPREEDLSYYRELAAQAGCSNYSIHYNADLYLLLALSQVLVHCYSTVGIEAVYFGLPAIILDYRNQDLLHFAAEGVAQQALDAKDLHRQLMAVQSGVYALDEKKKQAYIKKYACAVDGKVSERTAQALLSAGAE